jgi:gamma-glutamyl:cysteine ligase YbdK (ATP-grasp superfamily)
MLKKTLFDDNRRRDESTGLRKEVTSLERLKSLEDKITTAIDRVKTLKEEQFIMQRKIKELEGILNEKNEEIEQLRYEKDIIRNQIEGLLDELETLVSEKE